MPKTKAKAATATSKPKTVQKKAPAKKPTVVKHVSKERAASEQSFFEFKITQQTLYWMVLGLVSIIFAIWIVSLDSRIQKLYDEIDASTYSIDQPMPTKKTTTNN